MAYFHLAVEGGWPGVALRGLEVGPDGFLGLANVPRTRDPVSDPIPPVPGLEGPVGVAVDPRGNVYLSDPVEHRILRLAACEDVARPLACVRGPGGGAGSVREPRGLAVDGRGRLWVADAGNARVQAWDLATGQVTAVWTGPWTHGRGTVRLAEPWDLAVEVDGALYVADPGAPLAAGARRNGQVLKFGPDGGLDGTFLRRMQGGAEVPRRPTSVALVPDPDGGGDRLLVLDRDPPAVLVFHLDGRPDPRGTAVWRDHADRLVGAHVLAASGGRIYMGTPTGGALAFDSAGAFVGHAGSGDAPVAGLALDCEGRLVAHPGTGGAIVRSPLAPSYNAWGRFLTGPFQGPAGRTRWQRLTVDLARTSPDAHLRLYTLTSDILDGEGGRTPDPVPSGTRDAHVEVAAGEWRAVPEDVSAAYVASPPARYLWVSGVFTGNRRATVRVRQIRVDHDRGGWAARLPALYRRDPEMAETVDRFLTLFETIHDDARDAIDDLPRLFDPAAAPDDPPAAPWLDWLAGWLDVRLEEDWDGARRRAVVAEAFRAQGLRGTARHLERILWLHAGVRARVREGAKEADVWVLGASPLGRETRPTGAPVQGSVLDRTATVDRSHLLTSGPYGAELFDDLVHCLYVHIYRADLPSGDALDRVRRILAEEVPAHLVHRICIIEPSLTVGHQARVGVDAIVSGPPAPAAPGSPLRLGRNSVLPPAVQGPRRTGPVRAGDTLT